MRMQASAAGSPASGKQEVASCWLLRPPPPLAAHQSVSGSGAVPLPLPCPYLMSAHHTRYLLSSSQNQGWRTRSSGAQQDTASHVLGQDNAAARRLHAAGFADTPIIRRPSSWSAGGGVASRWPSTSTAAAAAPSPSSGRSSISSSTEQAACSWTMMTNKKQQQQAPSSRIAVPMNLEISLGRQEWQHNHLQDHHQQQQQQQRRSGESPAPKELILLKCL